MAPFTLNTRPSSSPWACSPGNSKPVMQQPYMHAHLRPPRKAGVRSSHQFEVGKGSCVEREFCRFRGDAGQ
jgi:hypothetical protein